MPSGATYLELYEGYEDPEKKPRKSGKKHAAAIAVCACILLAIAFFSFFGSVDDTVQFISSRY